MLSTLSFVKQKPHSELNTQLEQLFKFEHVELKSSVLVTSSEVVARATTNEPDRNSNDKQTPVIEYSINLRRPRRSTNTNPTNVKTKFTNPVIDDNLVFIYRDKE